MKHILKPIVFAVVALYGIYLVLGTSFSVLATKNFVQQYNDQNSQIVEMFK